MNERSQKLRQWMSLHGFTHEQAARLLSWDESSVRASCDEWSGDELRWMLLCALALDATTTMAHVKAFGSDGQLCAMTHAAVSGLLGVHSSTLGHRAKSLGLTEKWPTPSHIYTAAEVVRLRDDELRRHAQPGDRTLRETLDHLGISCQVLEARCIALRIKPRMKGRGQYYSLAAVERIGAYRAPKPEVVITECSPRDIARAARLLSQGCHEDDIIKVLGVSRSAIASARMARS